MRIDSTTHFQILARKCIWIVGVFAGAGLTEVPAHEPNDLTQQCVTAVYRNLQAATVRIRSGVDSASGVIVSESGLILTVAHGLKPDADFATVVFPGDKSCEAKIVIVDRQADVALLEMPFDSLRNFARGVVPVPEAADCVIGELVFAGGIPARETDGVTTVVRLGEILAKDLSAIRSSCTLTSGDSGGPLLNSRGELIGLHWQIGIGTDSNTHLALPAIHHALEKSNQWKLIRGQSGSDTNLPLHSKDLMPSENVIQAAIRATVEIHCSDTDGESGRRVPGTLLDAQHVAAKLSEIDGWPDLSCRFSEGSVIAATISKSDQTRDLAILKLPYAIEAENMIADPNATFQNRQDITGQIVFAATGTKTLSKAGIVCRIDHDEPSQPVRFGAAMETVGQQQQITQLSPNGSAVLAGLQIGDMLLTMDTSKLSSLQVVSELLGMRQPGDWVLIDAERSRKRLTVHVQLQRDPGQQFEKTEFLDGRAGRLSQRRSGFKSVLQHDISIAPTECGGPLLDSHGRIVAINIARRAREATFAIPIQDVIELAK